ncbi:MAG: hypothetical protein AAFN70_06480, partial [Planctomycetota bacterium]
AGVDVEEARKASAAQMKALEDAIKDTALVQIGLDVDPESQNVSIDLVSTAVEGSDLALMSDESKPAPSKFSAVVRDDVAAFFHASQVVGEKAIQQQQAQLDGATDLIVNSVKQQGNVGDEEMEEIKAMIQRLMGMIGETAKEGRIDGGLMVATGDNKLRVVGGFAVADGKEAAKFVQDIAAKMENDPEAPNFEFNQSTYNGVTMHSMSKEVPADKEEARRMFGEAIDVKIGTAEKAVYVSMGPGSVELMKALIDSADSDDFDPQRPLVQVNVSMQPILKFAESIQPNDMNLAMLSALANAADKDNISMIVRQIPQGSSIRLTVEEGVMRAMGAVAAEAQRLQLEQRQGGF